MLKSAQHARDSTAVGSKRALLVYLNICNRHLRSRLRNMLRLRQLIARS
jgi:hypothetical protein